MSKYSLSQILIAHKLGENLDGVDINNMKVSIDNDHISIYVMEDDDYIDLYGEHPNKFMEDLCTHLNVDWEYV